MRTFSGIAPVLAVFVGVMYIGLAGSHAGGPADHHEKASSGETIVRVPDPSAAGGVDTSIDPVALHNYLSFHGAVPAPRTIFNGVKKLAPATLLTLEPDGTRREEIYWRCPVQSRDRVLTESEWTESVRASLRTAVERRRPLMEAWASYCGSQDAGVIVFPSRAQKRG